MQIFECQSNIPLRSFDVKSVSGKSWWEEEKASNGKSPSSSTHRHSGSHNEMTFFRIPNTGWCRKREKIRQQIQFQGSKRKSWEKNWREQIINWRVASTAAKKYSVMTKNSDCRCLIFFVRYITTLPQPKIIQSTELSLNLLLCNHLLRVVEMWCSRWTLFRFYIFVFI